ncbi:fumarylacetoacetate hydrolase family protein [Streptomyces sp. NPDC085932]|uniref:fumarylacetoacetate hydrolase family protein n=1 Tax=Streptomyces sp. NPDC085932 TaxID=3365741 RepID=UPI0037D4CEFA
MKLVSFGPRGGEEPGVLADEETIVPLRPLLTEHGLAGIGMPALLALFPTLRKHIEKVLAEPSETLPLARTRIGPPVPRPGSVYAVGANYPLHVAELAGSDRRERPNRPVLFAKTVSSINGPNDAIVKPVETQALDYEIELAVVIGDGGRRITRDDAMDHVAGYMIANDVTARDVFLGESKKNPLHLQTLCGKGYDTFCPTGPWLVTADDIPDYRDLRMRLWVNQELRQDATPGGMSFDIPDLIAAASSCFTLRPGDVLLTGTPAGVGVGLEPPQFLTAGDELRLEISGLGEMRTRIVGERSEADTGL